MSKTITRESVIQTEILQWLLKQPGYLSWRNFIGGIPRGPMQRSKNPMAGFPDIFGFDINNRAFAIEVKNEIGVTSEKQRIWFAALAAKGVHVFVARDLDTVIAELYTLRHPFIPEGTILH